MKKVAGLIFFFFSVIYCPLSGQETDYGPGYQTVLLKNPAFTGSTGEGTMRFSYLNFYPGNSYNFHSVYFSYDSYFPLLHGGAGIYFSDDYLGGLVNDLRGGLSYSYFLQAGKELYINAGLTASFFHRGFNFGAAVLPEQIDQLGRISIPPTELLSNKGRAVFDIGTGFLLIYRRYFGSIGITHLTEPDLAGTGSQTDRMKRKYFLSLAADYVLDQKNQLKIRPVTAVEIQGGYFSVCAGAVVESNYLSVNSLLYFNNYNNIDLQAGFSLKKERLSVFYNYKFSLKPGDSLLPFSLLHQTGLAFSLNNVEKRIRIRTINLPDL